MARKKKRYKSKRTYKRKRAWSSHRDFLSPEYKKWREDVRARDGRCCQWPGCGSKKQLQAHHIKTWSKHPLLRFELGNGITLCRRCHDKIKGKEHDYEVFFLKLLHWNMIEKIKKFGDKRNE